MNSNYPIIVVGIEKQAAIMLPSTKPERTHMTTSTKTTTQDGLDISYEVATRMQQITGKTDLYSIVKSPAYKMAQVIIADERGRAPRSIERRFGLFVELLKGQYSDQTYSDATKGVFGLLKANVLTIEQAHECVANIRLKLIA